MKLELHSYWRSSASWRVRIALNMKGLEYDYSPVHLVEGKQNAAEHTARNPMNQIPVLVCREADSVWMLSQSMAILEFLEEQFPKPALLPTDLRQRAKARQLAEVVNSGIQPVQNLAVLQRLKAEGVDARLWGADFIRKGLFALEALASECAGSFLVGDRVTFADICLIPQLYNARRFNLELDGMPTLMEVEARCTALPAFAAAHPDQQPDAPTLEH